MGRGGLRPDQYGLQPHARRPGAFGEQRGRDACALAGLLPSVQAGHDPGEQGDRRGVIARSERVRGRRNVPLACEVHQAAARPVRRHVEAGQMRVRTFLAEAGDVGVDQPGIEGGQYVVFQAQLLARPRREVRHQHIGPPHQTLEHGPGAGRLEVEREAALVAVVQLPGVVDPFDLGVGRDAAERTVCVARVRWFHLDDVGAEVTEDGGRGGPGNETGEIDDVQSLQEGCAAHDYSLSSVGSHAVPGGDPLSRGAAIHTGVSGSAPWARRRCSR